MCIAANMARVKVGRWIRLRVESMYEAAGTFENECEDVSESG